MKILSISGSLRRGSYNTSLLGAAAGLLADEVEFELWGGLKEVPPYDEDDDTEEAPAAVAALRQAIAGADAVLFATPEYTAPIEMAGHADCALAAAREMLHSRLPGFNGWLKENGLGDGFRMGIGLSSGPIMSGTVGSERRLEYTTVGDTTNTAARLEAMTKNTPYPIFIADSTRRSLRQPPEDLVFADELDVRGKRSKVRLWTLAEHGESETRSDVVRTRASRRS